MEPTRNDVKNEVAEVPQSVLAAPAEHRNELTGFAEAYRIGKVYAGSGVVPAAYAGKPNDCAIAVDMANRMGVSPLMVMQQLYVVKGKPSWSGQACLAFLRNRFRDVQVVYTGQRGTDHRGCYIQAKNGETTLQGTEITLAMAKAEGWMSNPKWRNMPEQMLAYRAGAFFARVYCPDVLMGCCVEGEADDTAPAARTVEDVL